MKQPIELRRIRDFGQIINDSFTFLKENFKPLFSALLIICGFFIVLGTITSVLSHLKMTTVIVTDLNNYNNDRSSVSYVASVIFDAIVLILSQSFIHLITLCYISVYLQKGNLTPTFAEVWGYFRYYFWRVFGSSLLITVLSVVSFFLCIIPFFYLLPIFYLIIPVIVIENASFRYSFNKSFQLIKDNWWVVFGVIIIMSLIVSVAGSFANVPLTFITLGSKFVLKNSSFTLPLIVLFSALKNILLLLSVLPSIAICLCYFNLSELKDGTGLLDRIEKLGKSGDDNSTQPAEEY